VGSKLLKKEDGHATQESVFKSGFEEVATMQVSDTVVNHGLVYDKEEKKNVQSKSQEREHLVMTKCNSLEQERDKREIKYQTQSLLSSSSESSESSSLDEKETSLRVLFHNSMKKLQYYSVKPKVKMRHLNHLPRMMTHLLQNRNQKGYQKHKIELVIEN
jgi:hypothetical protein